MLNFLRLFAGNLFYELFHDLLILKVEVHYALSDYSAFSNGSDTHISVPKITSLNQRNIKRL